MNWWKFRNEEWIGRIDHVVQSHMKEKEETVEVMSIFLLKIDGISIEFYQGCWNLSHPKFGSFQKDQNFPAQQQDQSFYRFSILGGIQMYATLW